jgi:ComF family protein
LNSIIQALKTIFSDLDHLVFPPRCLLCEEYYQAWGEREWFCRGCHHALFEDTHESCPRCSSTVGPFTDLSAGCPRCRNHTFHFKSTIRLGPYDGKRRDAILRMKFLPGETLAEACGRVFADKKSLRDLKIDAVVPVPLHWQRRIARGFNQSDAIAFGIAEGLNKPVHRLVKRNRATTFQAESSAGQRWLNIKGVFTAVKPCQNLSILLVDDVLTTGATCSEIAKVLKAAGAAQVYVAVLAHESPLISTESTVR